MQTQSRPGVLSERNMRWYLGGQILSITGLMLQSAVLALLVLKLVGKTDAPLWSGLVYSLGFVPGMFLGPFAGIILDKGDKRKILMVTSALSAVQPLVLAYLTWTEHVTVAEICILALFAGVTNAIDGPGRNVIVKDAVLHPHNVRPASKMFTSLYNLAQIIGPGMAGYLVLNFGFASTFLLNGFSCTGALVALAMMKLVPRDLRTASAALEKKGVWHLVCEGARYTFSHPSIRVCVILTTLLLTFGMSYFTLLAVIARDVFHGDPLVYSRMAMCSGAGSFVGVMASIKFDGRMSHRWTVVIGMLVLGTTLTALSQTTDVDIAMLLIFIAGTCFMATFSTIRSSIIHLARRELSGIVMGFTFTCFYAGMIFGSFGAGAVANHIGCMPMLGISGIALMALGVAANFSQGVRGLDAAHS